ncbi:MmgE/PrpD family protein [Chitinasiproducens palmae]|uniref:2-methylcitrate dehydratase PrpD n=1 Tax=Chitinasiproducens palmae TaxID=1770053 RepID=A0A1H2PUB1_9BURK|nr:MmgE/PrpD family protein [Chitinasiproducens palmae]SDV50763.1 2-methylcitrate dehydratase PrpD [Chitinasiproducens palmae]
MSESYVQRLGLFVASRERHLLPASVLDRLQACLLFNLSVALAAPAPDSSRHAIEASHAAPGAATCWRTGATLTPGDAACRNAALITARGQNDTHAAMNGHIGCVAIPAVLSLAEAVGASSSDVCAALVSAYEVAPWVARGAAADSGARGLRGTSLYGVFAAAAGAARVLRLGPHATAAALSIATQFSGGTMQCWAEGTPEWLLQVGMTSRAGVIAAQLAAHGMAGAARALEGENGFYRAFAGQVPVWDRQDAAPHEILDVTFKPFPGCTINQLPVKTLLDCKRAEAFSAESVARIKVTLHPAYAAYPGVARHGPFDTVGSAIMSAPFMLQTVLENDTIALTDFAPGSVPSHVHERSRQITIDADSQLEPFHCRLEIALKDGRTLLATSGSPAQLAYGLDETVRLTRELAHEWAVIDSSAAHALLARQIAAVCQADGDEGSYTALLDTMRGLAATSRFSFDRSRAVTNDAMR